MSLNLLPLRFRCVRFTRRSARTSRPPDILLSLSSNCSHTCHLEPSKNVRCAFHQSLPTFLSLSSLGISATLLRPTLMRLSSSRLENSCVIPSIFPSSERQLSRTSSFTCRRQSQGTFDVESVTDIGSFPGVTVTHSN